MKVEKLAEDVTVYCGDCLEVLPNIGHRVAHVISDPPYEASLHASKNSLRGPVRVDAGPDLKGLDFDPIDAIRAQVVRSAESICDGWFIAFCTIEGVAKWADEINASRLKYKRACIWIKPDSTPQLNGQGPAQGAECFVTAWAGKGHAVWNAGGKRGVYTHCVNGNGREGSHPTEKPVSLMAELISDFTRPGEYVCDPFMGSGTTGVAAVKAGRHFVGIEKDQKWFDLACRRISDALSRPDLFVSTPVKAVQQKLAL